MHESPADDHVRLPPAGQRLVDAAYASHTDRIRALIPYFFLQVWNARRVELTEAMWSPDIVFHPPTGLGTIAGRAGLLEYVRHIQDAFSDLWFEVDDVVASGDRLVLRVTQTGIHSGEYFGFPPTGRPVRMSEVFIFRAAPGGRLGSRIEEIWLMLNALDLVRQMGFLPDGDPPRALMRAIAGAQAVQRRLRPALGRSSG